MPNFFARLFDSSGYVPRAVCGSWTRGEILLHNVSDLLIALAYVSIPLLLVFFARRRRDFPMSWMSFVFAAFIVTCGATHVMEIVLFYEPMYRLAGWLKAVTALASWIAVLALYRILPTALALRTPAELEAVNLALSEEIKEKERAHLELAEAHRRLRASERLKDEFLANVSHELRTPLTLILSPVEHLLAEPKAREERLEQTLSSVRNNGLRLLHQVNLLLDFSKAAAGKLEIHRQPTDLAALTRKLCDEFAPLARRQEQTVLVEGPEVLPVLMDRYLFERILFNLLSNALRFSSAKDTVTVTLTYDNPLLTLALQDTGPGIPEDQLPQLFDRFRQVSGGSTRRHGGTGLGLALVKEFASALGGTASARSTLGHGSTFTVELLAPATAESGEPIVIDSQLSRLVEEPLRTDRVDPELGPPAVAQSDEVSILIAEDNLELGDYLRVLLRGLGQVTLVRDGLTAERALRERLPDLLLADVMMPGQDGFALCRAVKSDPDLAHLPVVLVTALTHREALLQGWEAGADEYLFKPFHPAELLTRVRSLLESSRLRLALEKELRRSNQELEEKVAERSQELTRRNAELEATLQRLEFANGVKSRFLANLSHELRTPMVGILGLSELAQGEDDEQKEGALRKIHRAARGLDTLLTDLLDFSKLEAGRLELRPSTFRLGDILEDVSVTLESLALQRSLKLRIQLEPVLESACFYADGGRLRHVLVNLVQNGLKFTDSGSVELSVSESERGEQSSTLTFQVSDTGPGIPAAQIGDIFEPFAQLDESLAKRAGGAGLGLSICRELLQLMGSRISVQSELGKGTCFTFELRLPRADDSSLRPSQARPHRSGTILLVEDNPLNRAIISSMLEKSGHRVSTAADAEGGLQLLEGQSFDLALLDLQLPGLDGISLARLIRKRWGAELPLVALTAHGEDSVQREALAAGMDEFLVKPASFEDLLACVSRHLPAP